MSLSGMSLPMSTWKKVKADAPMHSHALHLFFKTSPPYLHLSCHQPPKSSSRVCQNLCHNVKTYGIFELCFFHHGAGIFAATFVAVVLAQRRYTSGTQKRNFAGLFGRRGSRNCRTYFGKQFFGVKYFYPQHHRIFASHL